MDCEKYERDYRRFTAKLQRLTAERGVHLGRPPLVNGIRQDLFKLYRSVSSFGGFAKVDDQNQWQDVANALGWTYGSCNAEVIIRQIYSMYLSGCESGVGFDDEDEELVEVLADSRPWTRSKSVNLTSSTALSSGMHTVHNTENIAVESYDCLILALTSGLPNEVDVAISTCLLLSRDEDKPFLLAKAPQLVPLLLSHIGVFATDTYTYQTVACHAWPAKQCVCFSKFWQEMGVSFQTTGKATDSTRDGCTEAAGLFTGHNEERLSNDQMLFRVAQVLTILGNLSLTEDNAYQLSQSSAYFQLLLWCIGGNQSSLKRLAVNSLALISQEVVLKDFQSSYSSQLILRSLEHCLVSPDRLLQLKGLEVLSKLCTLEGNDDVLYTELDEKVYESIQKSLIVPDVELLVAALETLYQLTSLGTRMCNIIITLHSFTDMLGSLLTFQVESLGSDVLSKVKVIEKTVPPRSVMLSLPIQQSLQLASVTTPPVQVQLVSLSQSAELPRVVAPQTLVQVPTEPALRSAESEAEKWLLDSYVVDQHGSVSVLQMYSDYMDWVCHKNMVCTVEVELFNRLVKSVFPDSESRLIGNEQKCTFVVGISSRRLVHQDQDKPTTVQAACKHTFSRSVPIVQGTPANAIPSLMSANQTTLSSSNSSLCGLSVCSSNIEVACPPLSVASARSEQKQQNLLMSCHPGLLFPSHSAGELVSSCFSTTVCSTPTLVGIGISHLNQHKDITSVVMTNRTPVVTARIGSSVETGSRCKETPFCSPVILSTSEKVNKQDSTSGTDVPIVSYTQNQRQNSNLDEYHGLPGSLLPSMSFVSSGCPNKELVESIPKRSKGVCSQSPTSSVVEMLSPECDQQSHSVCPYNTGIDVYCSCPNYKSDKGKVANCVVARPTPVKGMHVVSNAMSCYGPVQDQTLCSNAVQLSLSAVPQYTFSSSYQSAGSNSRMVSDCPHNSGVALQALVPSEELRPSTRLVGTDMWPSKPIFMKQNTNVTVLRLGHPVPNRQSDMLDLQATDEGSPLTKTVRLSAALVIRNLLIHSPLAVRKFSVLERLMLELSQQPLECAGILAECLYELTSRTEGRL